MRRRLLWALVLTVVATGLVVVWTRSIVGMNGQGELVREDEKRPPGAWNLGVPILQESDELARLLALPYATGEMLATAPGLGVIIHDPQRAQPGVNFYVSGHASEAILVDMNGRFLHRWAASYRDSFPDNPARSGASRHNLRRAALLPNGDVIVLWHGGGLARLNAKSKPIWTIDLGFYNDLFYDEDARGRPTLIALHKTAEIRPGFGDEPILNDQLLWIDAETGSVQRRVSLLDAVIASQWAPLLTEEHPDPADLLHANTITVLDERMVEGTPFRPGSILVSMREISLVAILDPDADDGVGELVWGLHGPFVRQHEPVLLPGGELLVFDNQWIEKDKARVLRLSLDGDVLWSYPDPAGPTADRSLSSYEVGVVRFLENGNLLVVESIAGRAIELAPDASIVWQFETPHRTGPQGRLIATLMDVERLPRPAWLEQLSPIN